MSKSYMLVKIFTNIHTSPTFFTNIHISPTYIFHQREHFSPTYRKIFTNIIHQHTYNFEWTDLFSPTYYFTNIIFTNIMKFRRWMLVKVFHQHTRFSPTCIFHQHISPTLEWPFSQENLIDLNWRNQYFITSSKK